MNYDQSIAFEAARQVKRICEENQIRYFFLAGSTLGAVRHGGFIPWDDDIDIGIEYEDMKSFEAVSGQLSLEYQYVSHHVNAKYPRFNGKILYHGKGCMDIFPIVRMSDNKAIASFQWNFHKILLHVLFRKHRYHPEGEGRAFVVISKILSPIISRKRIIAMDDWLMSLCSGKDTAYRCNITSKYSYKKELIRSEWIDKAESVVFEGETFNSIGCIDEYLTHLYGDYMQLPPESERKAVHETSFAEFM